MRGVIIAAAALVATVAQAGEGPAPMLRGLAGWSAVPLFTVGETVAGHLPPGLLDGIGAFALDESTVRVLVNHELWRNAGPPYRIGDLEVVGARISVFDIDRASRAVRAAGIAYDRVVDHAGAPVVAARQLSQQDEKPGLGLSRLCSGQGVAAGTFGLVDDIYFAGEEIRQPTHAHGGSIWALDVAGGTLWAVSAMGRGAWENVTPLATGDGARVAFLLADDTAQAPLMLYVGIKDPAGGFLARNGLVGGRLHAWKADRGLVTPAAFHGRGASTAGRFVPLPAANCDGGGCDAQGMRNADSRIAAAYDLGAFRFSRLEDLATDPADPRRAVVASTGGAAFAADRWGTLYVIAVDFSGNKAEIPATLTILHDGDSTLPDPDHGLRNPDNLDWSEAGIFVQEDRAEKGGPFGRLSGREAAVWHIDPATGEATRIAEIDRSAVAPAVATDFAAGDIGHWESSGILDVTALFDTAPGERLLLATVQAHGITDGPIAAHRLVEGGQLLWLSGR